MSVSGTMALSQATFIGGNAGIKAQRGTATWGANYVFNPSGLQNDIYVMSDYLATVDAAAFSTGITPDVSGSYYVGTDAYPLAASGAVFEAADTNVPMKLVIYANGLVSGVPA